jgi:hypothetical protein
MTRPKGGLTLAVNRPPYTWGPRPDLRRGLSVGNREGPLITRINDR